MCPTQFPLVPAKAGIQAELDNLARRSGAPGMLFCVSAWVPAFAGMSGVEERP